MDKESNPAPNLIPYIQAALRFLGVYLLVVGASGVVEDLASMIIRFRSDLEAYGEAMFLDYIFPPRFYGSAVYFGAGLYLLIGGHWLIRNIFTPASSSKMQKPIHCDDSEGA